MSLEAKPSKSSVDGWHYPAPYKDKMPLLLFSMSPLWEEFFCCTITRCRYITQAWYKLLKQKYLKNKVNFSIKKKLIFWVLKNTTNNNSYYHKILPALIWYVTYHQDKQLSHSLMQGCGCDGDGCHGYEAARHVHRPSAQFPRRDFPYRGDLCVGRLQERL